MNLRRRLPILAAAVMLLLAVGCSNNNTEGERLRKEVEGLKAATPVATAATPVATLAPPAPPTPTASPTSAPPASATAPPVVVAPVAPVAAPTMSAPAQSPRLVMMTETEACSVAQFEYIKHKEGAFPNNKFVVGDCTKMGVTSEGSGTQTRWSFSFPMSFTLTASEAAEVAASNPVTGVVGGVPRKTFSVVDYVQVTDFGGGRYTTHLGRER